MRKTNKRDDGDGDYDDAVLLKCPHHLTTSCITRCDGDSEHGDSDDNNVNIPTYVAYHTFRSYLHYPFTVALQ